MAEGTPVIATIYPPLSGFGTESRRQICSQGRRGVGPGFISETGGGGWERDSTAVIVRDSSLCRATC